MGKEQEAGGEGAVRSPVVVVPLVGRFVDDGSGAGLLFVCPVWLPSNELCLFSSGVLRRVVYTKLKRSTGRRIG